MSDTVFIRHFRAELEEGDGRTLFGRLVPYNEVATVADNGPPYEELFAPEAFKRDPRLRKAPNRVELKHEHRDGLMETIGYGVEFAEMADGLYGTFRALETNAGEQGLAMARAGILRAFSIGFQAVRSRREGGVVARLSAKLDEVSLCRDGAYAGTALSMRKAATVYQPAERNAELDSRLAMLGFRAE
jgi:uncharacterized protein